MMRFSRIRNHICYDPRNTAYDPKQAEAFRASQAWRLGILDKLGV